MRRLLVLTLLVLAPGNGWCADDADLLKSAGVPSDGTALLEFLKNRSRYSVPEEEIRPFAADLASADPKVAEKAMAGLIVRGTPCIAALRRTVNDLNSKLAAERAAKCLSAIEGRTGAELSAAVVRLVGQRKPVGAVEALLNFIPFADDANVLEATASSLAGLAYPENKAHPALLKAIDGEVPVLRALAAEALTRADHPETRAIIAKRLTDTSRPVRQRTALALARVEDVNSIPVLVELMGDLSRAERLPVEEMLRNVAGETIPKNLPTGDDAKDRKALQEAWGNWWRKVDGPALVDEFRSRSLAPGEETKVADLVKQLGDREYRVRERATVALISMGAKALSALRAASKDSDSERVKRAEDIIVRINQSDSKRVPIGSARLVALRRPELATQAMLGYLPFADEDDAMIAEVRTALTALAISPNGDPDPALLAALSDKESIRRSVAAEALAKGGGLGARPAVKKLLGDPDLVVRQTVAAALTLAGDRDAVPVLIDIIGELPSAQAWPSQDLLAQIAGDKAPVLPATKADDRKALREIWLAWWKDNAMSVDLARLTSSPGYLGYTLVVEVGNNQNGRVAEVTRDGKIRWQVGGLRYPVDATVLPGERVLITEWDGNRVAEWDFKGNQIWKKDGFNGRATNAQRMPNGNTFICTTNELIEVDRAGKTVFSINVAQGLTAAYRSTAGEIVCLRNDGQVARYDTSGKELKTFPSNRDTSWTSGIDLARNGNILVSQPSPNQKVTEYTPDGKVVKEWVAPNVTTATRMTNGHILAASHSDKKVIELDPSGKKVWEYGGGSYEFHIFRAKRR